MRSVQKKQPIRQARGVALVTALLIVSLATIMAVSLMSRQYLDVRRTGNIMLSDQAYLYSLAMENFAGQLLAYYRDKGQSEFDNRADFEAALLQFSAFPVDGGTVSVNVSYPEAMFNVNSLIKEDGSPDEKQRMRYRRLLTSVIEDLGSVDASVDNLVDALIDWIDPNQETHGGAEDGTYESKDVPYKTADRMMSSISELRLVEGYSHELLYGFPGDEDNEPIAGLLSYVTALPDRNTKLNVNLVTEAKQFFALSTHIDEDMSEGLVVDDAPYENVADFKGSEIFDSVDDTDPPAQQGGESDRDELYSDISDMYSVQSHYFLLRGVATVGQARIDLNSLIYVAENGKKLEVISRSIGTVGI